MEKKSVVCNAEFSAELVLAVPYAYWLHTNGMLDKTVSVKDTKTLYYFSDNHEERYPYRTIDNQAGLGNIPNTWIHHNAAVSNGKPGILDFSQWKMPPFKQHYKNKTFVYDKPLFVVSNKYAMEWGKTPINYLDIETLYHIFDYLKDEYTVVYKRPSLGDYVPDRNEMVSIGDIRADVNDTIVTDYELARSMGVIVYQDLLKEHPAMSFNELQFKLFANCDYYISVQGGNSHICALFGKMNINYIVEGKELRDGYFDKGTWYHKMNGCETIPVSTYMDLLHKMKELY